jgi:hypothetical protein
MIVDSKQQMLTVNEILQVAAEQSQSQYPLEIVYAAFFKEIQMPNSKFYRYGNTIFVIHNDMQKQGFGSFRALNADTAENFLQSSYQFVIDAYRAGFYQLVTKFKDQSLLNIFRIISKNPPNPGMGYEVRQEPDGQYLVTLQLGDPQTAMEGMEEPNIGGDLGQPMAPPQGMAPMGGGMPLGGGMPPMGGGMPAGGNQPMGALGSLASRTQGEV